jgi:2'-5' RNA ligase
MAAGAGLGAATPPFVLTLEMDGGAFARLNELRRRYYPPERNVVPAHVTLFHQLPGDHSREIKAFLRDVVSRQSAIDVEIGEAKEMGGGVAIPLRSPPLLALRERLAAEWWPWLVEQDRGGYRPHVTVQNKVGTAEARQARQEIAASLRPFTMRGLGLHLWRYRGGPWEDVQLFRFR